LKFLEDREAVTLGPNTTSREDMEGSSYHSKILEDWDKVYRVPHKNFLEYKEADS
jgi:hypothetical protein